MPRFAILCLPLVIAVSACTKHETQETVTETQVLQTVVTEFTLSKKCGDGTDVYQIDGGEYAIWDGQNNQWVKLSPGVAPDDYCD